MSSDIQFDDVRQGISVFGDTATFITVTDACTPHVVTALIEVGDDRLIAEVGAKTRDNLSRRPGLALVWQPVDAGDYQMILDGVADHLGDPNDHGVSTVSIVVTRGILHRLAGLPTAGPSCLAVGSAGATT